jgi:transposase
VIVARAQAAGLLPGAPLVTVDATGLEARRVSAYYRWRRGQTTRPGRRKRAWPKLTAVLDVHSHLLLGAVTGLGPAQDSPAFIPVVRQAAGLLVVDTVLADAGYDGEHNHALCRDALGIRRCVINLNPRRYGRRWPATPYRRAMRRAFPRQLYRQRWHAESGFSRLKRRLGSALAGRSTAAHQRETILRVLTYNLMLLARYRRGLSTEHHPV